MSVRTGTVIDTRDFGVIGGYRIIAEIVPDEAIVDPRDWDDSIGAAEYRAWRDGDWQFVTLIVRALDPAADREAGSAVMGRFTCGWLPGGGQVSPLDDDGATFANGYGDDLIAEALSDAARG